MKVRQNVYDTYWRFAALRQEIFFGRLRNAPAPWTEDPILATYKFCNTYRASDRVSQYLIKNVIYRGPQDDAEVVFRILLFKIFNKIETWKFLIQELGEIRLAQFNFDVYDRTLQRATDSGQPIYTSAYMSCANKAFGYERKHQNHLALIQRMVFQDRIDRRISGARSLRDVFTTLVGYPLLGNFMAYQLAIDINYSEVVNFSENDFTIAGPGAERGIKKCFVDTEGKSNEYVIQWMRENQEVEFARLGISFKSLWGRPLQAIDCQGLFCETDKYSRAAFPDLKSNRKRIKSRYTPNPATINYFYPPKWNINNQISTEIAYQANTEQIVERIPIQLPLSI